MPNWYEEEYFEWEEASREESAEIASDNAYLLDYGWEDRQRLNHVRKTLKGMDKKELKREVDKYIALRQGKDLEGTKPEDRISKIKEAAERVGLEVGAIELDFMIAESLQLIDASIDPRAEYYDWIEAQAKIETDLHVGGATQSEVDARNGFLYFLDERETEMRRIMALYSGAAIYGNNLMKEAAAERLNYMAFKMSELRRLRARTEATQNHADTKSFEEKMVEKGQETASRMLASGVNNMVQEGIANQYLGSKSLSDIRHHNGSSTSKIAQLLLRKKKAHEQANRASTMQKIVSVKRNKLKMYKLLNGYRNGLSREEQEDIEDDNDLALDMLEHHREFHRQHFTTDAYQQAQAREFTQSQGR